MMVFYLELNSDRKAHEHQSFVYQNAYFSLCLGLGGLRRRKYRLKRHGGERDNGPRHLGHNAK